MHRLAHESSFSTKWRNCNCESCLGKPAQPFRLPIAVGGEKSPLRFLVNQFAALYYKLYGDFWIVDVSAARLVPLRFPFREIRLQSRWLHLINRLQINALINGKNPVHLPILGTIK